MTPSSDAKGSYHHGDLRSALLAAAVELIEEKGLPKLSLRECARRAGVSHAAPYRHFADRHALLWAIAMQGFDWLYEAGSEAMAAFEVPADRLKAYGVAYVRFAYAHRVHHRVMFSAELSDASANTPREQDPSFQLLLDATAPLVAPGQDPLKAAVAAWALPHGLSMLILDGRIPQESVPTADAAEDLMRAAYGFWGGVKGA